MAWPSILDVVSELVLDAVKSRVRIHTFAEGLFAKLAHDLELACGELSGTASRRDAEGSGAAAPAGTASVTVPLQGLSVAGVLAKDGTVDERGLSPSERRDCLAKMHHDVFHAKPDAVVRVEGHAEGGSVRLRIVPPNGKSVEIVTRPTLSNEGDAVRAKGAFEVSLSAIGSDVVKGPMGAFRVKDRVLVTFDVVFAQPA
jgi:hypothetical protein